VVANALAALQRAKECATSGAATAITSGKQVLLQQQLTNLRKLAAATQPLLRGMAPQVLLLPPSLYKQAASEELPADESLYLPTAGEQSSLQRGGASHLSADASGAAAEQLQQQPAAGLRDPAVVDLQHASIDSASQRVRDDGDARSDEAGDDSGDSEGEDSLQEGDCPEDEELDVAFALTIAEDDAYVSDGAGSDGSELPDAPALPGEPV
jgi:hypothetical protein